MLETGRYAPIKEIARAEKINPSYVSRVLRLTLLAPATVEAIIRGQTRKELTLARLWRRSPSHGRSKRVVVFLESSGY